MIDTPDSPGDGKDTPAMIRNQQCLTSGDKDGSQLKQVFRQASRIKKEPQEGTA
jgi:hypothetical protein